MRALAVLVSRLFDVVLRRRRDTRIDDEIAAHLEMLAADGECNGLTPDEAVRAARRAFGGVDQVKAAYRDQRGWPWLEAWRQDLQGAVRSLRRAPGSSATIVGVLAFGIGLSHLFFTLTYAHTRRGLPVAHPEQLVFVASTSPAGGERGLSFADLRTFVAAQRSFIGLAAFLNAPVTLSERDRASDRVDGAYATSAAFALTGAVPLIGRTLAESDDSPGASPVLVLTERVWRLRYDADPVVLGRRVQVSGREAVIVGVVSDRSGVPSAAAVFLPLSMRSDLVDGPGDARVLRVFGRLRPAVVLATARAEADILAAQVFADSAAGTVPRLVVRPVNDQLLGPLAGWLPFIVAGLVVAAVAGANVGNLLLVQAVGRARELAIRTSLGASRGRLLRHLVLESALMALVAGGLGLLLSLAGVSAYRSGVPSGVLPYWFDYSMDGTVFAAVWALAFTSVLIFAIGPAVQASRVAAMDVLKSGGRAETGSGSGRAWATAFLAIQLGLAVVLVGQVGRAALEVRGPALPSDAATHDPRVFTASVTLAPELSTMPPRREALLADLTQDVARLPGVRAVTLASHLPHAAAPERVLRVFAAGDDDPSTRRRVVAIDIASNYFATVGTPMLAGREFTAADLAPDARTVVVNERLAALHFAGRDPIGQRIALTSSEAADAPPEWRTIVGVAPVIRQGPSSVPPAVAYVPRTGVSASPVWLLARCDGDATALTAPVRAALHRLEPSAAIAQPRTLDTVARDGSWVGRVSERFALTVAGAAFLLATVGLYAVVAHRVGRRRRELAVRMALGANRRHVAGAVARDLARATIGGLAVGVVGLLAWSRFLAPPGAPSVSQPEVYAVAAAALVATVVLGSALPIRCALGVAPGEALRDE